MNRPKIPNATKRNVRKRCGYGCVICGMPIYEYDHIHLWSDEKKHRIDNITLLCPNHHSEKTKGLLDVEAIVTANKHPHNLQTGITKPYRLQFKGQECIVAIGDQLNFKTSQKRTGNQMIPFLINNIKPLSFRFYDKYLLLNLSVLDEENNPSLIVHDGELVFSVNNWDVEFIGRRLKIRKKKGVIYFDIEFVPPNKIVLWKFDINIHGHHVEIKNGKVIYKNLTITGAGEINASVGVNIGENKTGLGVGIQI